MGKIAEELRERREERGLTAQAVREQLGIPLPYLEAMEGRGAALIADEFYLMAGRDFPPADRYEGFSMHEDGIGMARTFEHEFHGFVDEPAGTRRGFFAAVDMPRNPTDYRTSCHDDPSPTQMVALAPRRSAPPPRHGRARTRRRRRPHHPGEWRARRGPAGGRTPPCAVGRSSSPAPARPGASR